MNQTEPMFSPAQRARFADLDPATQERVKEWLESGHPDLERAVRAVLSNPESFDPDPEAGPVFARPAASAEPTAKPIPKAWKRPPQEATVECPDCGVQTVTVIGWTNGHPVAGICPVCSESIYFDPV